MLPADGNNIDVCTSQSTLLIPSSNHDISKSTNHFGSYKSDIIFNGRKTENTSEITDKLKAAAYISPRAGQTGSFLFSSHLANGYELASTHTSSCVENMLQNQSKSRQLNMSNKKSSFTQPSPYALESPYLASKVYQIKCPSNAVLTRVAKQRPNSASVSIRQHPMLQNRGTNTLDSYLSQSKHLSQQFEPSSSSLKFGHLSSRQQRPKSSCRPNMIPSTYSSNKAATSTNTRTINFPSRIVLSNGVATLSQPVADICIIPEPSLDKIKGILSSKKLRPVYHEASSKSKLSAARSNGLHKLNIAVKSSAFNHTEQIAPKSNSSSSLHESSGISSACSFCSESLSECSCKALSSVTASDMMKSTYAASVTQKHSSVLAKSLNPTGKKKQKRPPVRPRSSQTEKLLNASLKFKELSLSETDSKDEEHCCPKPERYFYMCDKVMVNYISIHFVLCTDTAFFHNCLSQKIIS